MGLILINKLKFFLKIDIIQKLDKYQTFSLINTICIQFMKVTYFDD
jgi:hypothetical protein